jgi:hypothetical protein
MVPPGAFVKMVKDALDDLHDYTRLNNQALVEWLVPDPLPRGLGHAQVLRKRLLDAIEELRPSDRLAELARERRAYHLLTLRYVEAMPYREVMRTLALSQTQYHREQRHAVEMLAAYLWDTLPPALATELSSRAASSDLGSDEPDATERGDAESPVYALGDSRLDDQIRLVPFLEEVIQLLGPIAAPVGARLRLIPAEDDTVVTDRTTLRNAVIGAIGYLLDVIQPLDVALEVRRSPAAVRISISARGTAPARAPSPASEKLRLSRELMGAIGGSTEVQTREDAATVVSLVFPTRRTVLLVIDDNVDLIQLLVRYLAEHKWTVLSAGSVEEGIAAAQQAHPDVILMDVMMPHRDGWEALQLLRHHPSTVAIPVVICTILP